MSNDLITTDCFDTALQDLKKTKALCAELMKLPHYAKLGEVGIFAVTEKAKQMGMHPLEALNGGMYFVNGKVEMQGAAMLALIRKHGHSVEKDPKSTKTHVILHGKRADNGNVWSASFSIEDAKLAGIYKNVWEKYPTRMCTWRCVSELGMLLFSDIIKGCYVVGEISDAPPLDAPVNYDFELVTPKAETIAPNQAKEICDILELCSDDIQKKVRSYYASQKVSADFANLPVSAHEELYSKLQQYAMAHQESLTSVTIDVSAKEEPKQ